MVLSMLAMVAWSGCGVMGAPVAPESIGVNAKRQRDQIERRQPQRDPEERERIREEPSAISGPEGTDETEPAPFPDLTQPGAQPEGDVFVRPR
jgi:hypothetical protein